jgi:hypothetical protein
MPAGGFGRPAYLSEALPKRRSVATTTAATTTSRIPLRCCFSLLDVRWELSVSIPFVDDDDDDGGMSIVVDDRGERNPEPPPSRRGERANPALFRSSLFS